MDGRPHLISTALFGLTLLACGARKAEPNSPPPDILTESWATYTRKFIQSDGRVIDHRAGGISTSEGQAYAMLRAVWIGDRNTFDKTYSWAVNNLNAGVRKDHLWAWKWGKGADGRWRALDHAFATDADQDAALALVLASRRWSQPKYLADARTILADIWQFATVRIAGRRYLLAGDTLCKGTDCRVNPSYYAPYAYRIFQEADPRRNWSELADSSYEFLGKAARLSKTGLPPDWVHLDIRTGEVSAGTPKDSAFSYDAFRTFWRVALDYELFQDRRAARFLSGSLKWIDAEWGRRRKLPAVISSEGRAEAEYQSLEMIAGLMPALRFEYPEVAGSLNDQLQATYARGSWGERDSYYLQNWAWFGTAVYLRYLDPLR